MEDFGRNIFWAFFTELQFIMLAIILREDKRKVIIVLTVGTLVAGCVGFILPVVLPNSSAISSTSSDVTRIDHAIVEHNVFEDGQNGMRIYVYFRIVGKKGIPCGIYTRFYDSTGVALSDTNGRYTRPNGQVSTGENFTPQTDNTYYDRFILFIPYKELHIIKEGRHNLEFDIVLFDYQLEAIIDYSDFYPFELMIEAQ